jgi:hypothetical protein
MGMGHVNRSTLVSHIHDLNTLSIDLHPDGHDVPAAKGKHAADPTGF